MRYEVGNAGALRQTTMTKRGMALIVSQAIDEGIKAFPAGSQHNLELRGRNFVSLGVQ